MYVCYTIINERERGTGLQDRREHIMETTGYKYNELTGQWERVERVDTVEDTYTETRDFKAFSL